MVEWASSFQLFRERKKNDMFAIYSWDLIKIYKFNTEEKYLVTSWIIVPTKKQEKICHPFRKKSNSYNPTN